jgi:ribosomal protein S18 acetylase RimI-like enzyme
MKPVLILNDLFVDENHRRNGIAHQLLDAAVTHARKQGAIRLVLETGVNNTPISALVPGFGRSLWFGRAGCVAGCYEAWGKPAIGAFHRLRPEKNSRLLRHRDRPSVQDLKDAP